MSNPLGKIEKPNSELFSQKKKLFIIPLLFSSDKAPQEFKDMFVRYWQDAAEQLNKIEKSLGNPKYIFHEAISDNSHHSLTTLQRLNSGSYPIIQKEMEKGAQLSVLENHELVLAATDWERFMMIGIASEEVARIASENYVQTTDRRYAAMSENISKTLQEAEIALLFLREYQYLKLTTDIEIFNIAPPVLNDINKWLRDRAYAAQQESSEPIEEKSDSTETPYEPTE